MYKITYIFVLLTVCTLQVYSQVNQSWVDSITYQYFIQGDWQKLIDAGNQANKDRIDFKYLQQRMGYAYFMQGKHYSSIKHYENALAYDAADEITHLYLYYNHLTVGNFSKAAFHAGKISDETRKFNQIKLLKPISAIDYEFNIKIPDNELRENALFHRIGFSSQLTSQLSLYQSISTYGQTTDYTRIIRQNEYFGLMTFTPHSNISLQVGYHGIGSKIISDPDTLNYTGNLYLGKITYNKGRFDLGLSYSYLDLKYATSNQLGIQGGIGFSGTIPAYFKSSLYQLTESGIDLNNETYTYNRLVFQQTAGFMPFKRIWLEGFVTLGDMNNFADFNGLYVYNTADPTTFKTGSTVYLYPSSHWVFFLNYAFEQKSILLYNLQYQQNSFSGGIIWKI